mmetsp:Transcript_28355/g.74780  ORF Transcript_28355/g.74780 Transcript_28355/m.74780 type:complete len:109 (-) Transcript_28355:156-482(-)
MFCGRALVAALATICLLSVVDAVVSVNLVSDVANPTIKHSVSAVSSLRLRGGFSAVSSEDAKDSKESDNIGDEIAALGGVDITSIIGRHPSCDELRNSLLPLVNRSQK